MNDQRYGLAIHHLGFRPFFLLAGIYAIISMALWMWIYHLHPEHPHIDKLPGVIWHAHTMIYGYSMAVIAGFLLTAVSNWTGEQTLRGTLLISLSILWILARLMPFIDHPWALYWMALFDLLFGIGLSAAILIPILKVKQWSHIGVWSKVALLLVANTLFYSGLLGFLEKGIQWGNYAGFYLIVSLVLMMGRRVIPFFIEKGIDESTLITNPRWIDLSSLVLMLIFIVVEVFTQLSRIASVTALLLFIIHAYRLKLWYKPGIWCKPLLWILYVAYGWLVFGFALKAATFLLPINPMLAIHAFAVGGIGVMTVGMMARVILGHTGRNVFDPPPLVKYIFLTLVVASIVRIFLPMLIPGYYQFWIVISQVFWIISFGLFFWLYAPMLLKARVDGRYG